MFLLSFFTSVLIASFTFIKGNVKEIIVLLLVTTLTLFAGTRDFGVDRDYESYVIIFNGSVTNFDFEFLQLYEPAFLLLPIIMHFLFGKLFFVKFTFLFYSFIAVSTKIKAFENSNSFFLSVIIYCSYLFFSQEMTTIRAGLACAIFLWSIKDLVYGNDKLYFCKIFVAILFHYSSIVFIIVWIVIRLKLSLKYFYSLLLGSFLVVISKINILTLLKLDLIFPKIEIYLDLLELQDSVPVNIFNFRILFAIGIFLLFIYKIKILEKKPFFMVLFKIHILSLVLFYLLSPTAMVFSLRVFDMLSVVQLLLYPLVICVFKEKLIGYGIIFLFCGINLYYLFQVSEWYNDYVSWLFNFKN